MAEEKSNQKEEKETMMKNTTTIGGSNKEDAGRTPTDRNQVEKPMQPETFEEVQSVIDVNLEIMEKELEEMIRVGEKPERYKQNHQKGAL